MKIVTTSIDDFISNLSAGSVYQKRVWFERSSNPLNGKTKRDASSFEVILQASAVVEFENDGGQALLACGVNCGVDRMGYGEEMEGTSERNIAIGKLEDYCKLNGLQLMPGSLDQ